MSPREAEYPRPGHVLIHISDTHLLAQQGRLYDRVDATQRLRELLDALERTGRRPDAIVFTGDLADHGDADAYEQLRELVVPVAARMGARVIWVMGNHDHRGRFRTELLEEPGRDEPVDRVDWLGGLRVITLDTTVPGHHHGEVSDAQLAWLAEELAQPAPDGTILAMHHPPMPSVLELAVAVELRDQQRLAEVLRGSDVRSILAGHLHYSSTASFAGIPVSVASASCYTQDLLAPEGATRARDAAHAFNLVQVYPTTVLHAVVPVGESEALAEVDVEESRRRLESLGITRRGEHVPDRPDTQTRPIEVVHG